MTSSRALTVSGLPEVPVSARDSPLLTASMCTARLGVDVTADPEKRDPWKDLVLTFKAAPKKNLVSSTLRSRRGAGVAGLPCEARVPE